jgi:hypothetical protein
MMQYIQKIFPTNLTRLQLGRWNQTELRVSIIKSYLADIDNCGINNDKNNKSNNTLDIYNNTQE